jgi:hypothetical protein
LQLVDKNNETIDCTEALCGHFSQSLTGLSFYYLGPKECNQLPHLNDWITLGVKVADVLKEFVEEIGVTVEQR